VTELCLTYPLVTKPRTSVGGLQYVTSDNHPGQHTSFDWY